MHVDYYYCHGVVCSDFNRCSDLIDILRVLKTLSARDSIDKTNKLSGYTFLPSRGIVVADYCICPYETNNFSNFEVLRQSTSKQTRFKKNAI